MNGNDFAGITSALRWQDIRLEGKPVSRITTEVLWEPRPADNENELRTAAKFLRDRAAQRKDASSKHDLMQAQLYEIQADELARGETSSSDAPAQSKDQQPRLTTGDNGNREVHQPKVKSPKKEWWATEPPPQDAGWHHRPAIGNKKELAHCVGIVLRKKPVDVKTLPKLHEKQVWISRVTETTWQAYFRRPEVLADAEAVLNELRRQTAKGAEGSKGERKG